jgi:predicted permease
MDLLQDLRIAARQLTRQKAFAAVVVATLALAIGVNTLTFSFVNLFVFRPLPMKELARLVGIFGKHPEHARERALCSYADFLEWREESTSFEGLAAGADRTYNLTGAGDPMRVHGFAATASLFTEWGLGAVLGRVIQPEDDRKGAPRVALLSHGFWSRQFGADPRVVGTSLRLDGRPHVVVGVLTPSIEIGRLSEIEVWTPLTPEADPADRTARTLEVSGRLKHGVDLPRAAAEIQAIAERQRRDHPDTNAGWSAYVLPFRSGITGPNTWIILALMAVAVSLVLAIACANVANLMLARGAGRQRETALRAALGASRGRIVRLLLTEGLVLSILGGGLGLLLASWGLDLIRSVTFERFFALLVVDRRVAAFSAAISLLTPLLFGLLPALQATKVDLVTALKEGGASVAASRRPVLGRNLLVSGQLALALALLLMAGLVVRAALALRQLQLGFDHRQVLTIKTDLPEARYPADAQVRAFVARLEARLRGLPGVESAAAAAGRPVFEAGSSEPLVVEGVPWASEQARPLALKTVVGAGYFETLRITILKGRSFGAQDVLGSEPAVVVNEALAARHFPGQDPLGRRIRIGGAGEPARTIVGVAANVLNTDLGQPTLPQAYLPLDQQAVRTLTFLVRTGHLDTVVAAARREVAQLDPEQPLYDAKTMERAFFEARSAERLITGMFVLFASVALGLAILGLYSLISYLVSQRTREIGVRVALGASRADVTRLVLRQGARLVLAGLALGLLLGLGLARVMAGAVAGVSPIDSVTFTAVPLLLTVISLLATAGPARRAARVEPAVVLRAE